MVAAACSPAAAGRLADVAAVAWRQVAEVAHSRRARSSSHRAAEVAAQAHCLAHRAAERATTTHSPPEAGPPTTLALAPSVDHDSLAPSWRGQASADRRSVAASLESPSGSPPQMRDARRCATMCGERVEPGSRRLSPHLTPSCPHKRRRALGCDTSPPLVCRSYAARIATRRAGVIGSGESGLWARDGAIMRVVCRRRRRVARWRQNRKR